MRVLTEEDERRQARKGAAATAARTRRLCMWAAGQVFLCCPSCVLVLAEV